MRGARVLHKLCQRNVEQLKDLKPEQQFTNDILKDIAENVMSKAIQQYEGGRHGVALYYLSALSDYPDSLFDYEQTE